MVYEPRKQSMAWIETDYKYHSKDMHFSMEDKMVAGAFGHARNYGRQPLTASATLQQVYFDVPHIEPHPTPPPHLHKGGLHGCQTNVTTWYFC